MKRFMSSLLTAAVVLGGMALLSVPAAAQRGGGPPIPENCPAQPEWQVKSLADFQAALDKENPPAPAAAPGGGARGAVGGGRGGAAAGGRGGGRGGRGGGGAPAELPPVPRIPNEPQYGVQAGKPDFGGLAKGVWSVPYVINMASYPQGPRSQRMPRHCSLQARGSGPLGRSRVEEQRGRRSRKFLSASRRASHDVHPVSRADLSDARSHCDGVSRGARTSGANLDGRQAASQS